MNEQEIIYRLTRVRAAFGERTALMPENVNPQKYSSDLGDGLLYDFRGGRTETQLDLDANHIMHEIMGIRDRAMKWFVGGGRDPKEIDAFIKSELAVALVHDLANTDKHGELDLPPFSGYKPKLGKVDRALVLKYDPASGTYAATGQFVGQTIDLQVGAVIPGTGSSSGLEVVLACDIYDESGNKIGELQRVLPDAIYKWEEFLIKNGLVLQ